MQANHNDNTSIKVGDGVIASRSCVKLLWIKIGSKFEFAEHVPSICKKLVPCVGQNLKIVE